LQLHCKVSLANFGSSEFGHKTAFKNTRNDKFLLYLLCSWGLLCHLGSLCGLVQQPLTHLAYSFHG